jgi:hypothetical protein
MDWEQSECDKVKPDASFYSKQEVLLATYRRAQRVSCVQVAVLLAVTRPRPGW